MRHLKKSALILIIAVVAFSILFALTEGLAPLLFFPIIAFVGLAAVYLIKQGEKDVEHNIKDGVRYEVENQEAEQWIKHDLAPRTLARIKHHHWPIIIYSFVFVLGLMFLWSYLTVGSEGALRNTIYAGILFWLLIVYVYAAPKVFSLFYKSLPKGMRKHFANDWVRGYIFLLPLTFAAYLLSPFIGAGELVTTRLTNFPYFFISYTLLYLCTASILYLHAETKKEEEKRLRKSLKEYIRNE